MGEHIYWSSPEEKELERKVLAEYSPGEVRKHLEYLTTLTRMAGTNDERKAAEYIKRKLDEYGIESEIYEFEAYISHPGRAEIEILAPVQKSLPALAHGFIASTPPDGIEAELVSVGKGSADDYKITKAKEKIVLLEEQGQFRSADLARFAEENGAVGQIFIARGRPRSIGFMRLRNAWGGPIPETIKQIPRTPAVSICREDGNYLCELAKKGPISIRLKAEAWRGYKQVRQPIGTLRGMREPEKYVLFASHYCSWYIGATDNAAANSLLLEMARIFSKYRKELGRSVRFAWWTGHSQGSSAGSSWYADNFWEDIRENAVAYLNMDGLARAGSSGFAPENSEEIRKFHEGIIRQVLNAEVVSKRVKRSGDQSFWGMGLPSIAGSTEFAALAGGERVWYSHAAEDTVDKVDMEVLQIPFRINAISVLRLCNSPVLPWDFVTLLEVFKKAVADLQKKYHSVMDLTSLSVHLDELTMNVKNLHKAIALVLSDLQNKKLRTEREMQFKRINTCLMELDHHLIPVLSTKAGKYGQDPMGTKFQLIPLLQPLEELITMDSESEEFKALRTSLLRERNKLSDVLRAAQQVLDVTLEKI